MKLASLICLSLIALRIGAVAEGQESLADIQKERESVLKAIVEQAESEVKLGRAKPSHVAEAQINLLRFRSEIAKDVAEKKEHQRKIIAIMQELYSSTESLYRENRADPTEFLKVKERLLAEKQRLLEM